ncbi:hypothetical protein C9I36_12575 [Pectobacterium punjabense]|nr:hypothetical protein C9I36_12575 [Pectobacterium punjabense]
MLAFFIVIFAASVMQHDKSKVIVFCIAQDNSDIYAAHSDEQFFRYPFVSQQNAVKQAGGMRNHVASYYSGVRKLYLSSFHGENSVEKTDQQY